jgi:hypothetical protein
MRLHQSLSRAEIAFVVGVPLTWAVLLLFHPVGEEIVPTVRDNVTPWLVVHLGTLVLIPLLAVTLFLVLRRFDGTAALIARAALVVFAIVYTAFEILIGIGVGLLADEINALPAADQATGERLADAFTDSGVIAAFETIGSLAWLVAVAAAGVAMFRRAHTASSIAVVLLFVISAPGVVFHVPPFGQVGLALFVLALLLALRERAPARVEEPLLAA